MKKPVLDGGFLSETGESKMNALCMVRAINLNHVMGGKGQRMSTIIDANIALSTIHINQKGKEHAFRVAVSSLFLFMLTGQVSGRRNYEVSGKYIIKGGKLVRVALFVGYKDAPLFRRG